MNLSVSCHFHYRVILKVSSLDFVLAVSYLIISCINTVFIDCSYRTGYFFMIGSMGTASGTWLKICLAVSSMTWNHAVNNLFVRNYALESALNHTTCMTVTGKNKDLLVESRARDHQSVQLKNQGV